MTRPLPYMFQVVRALSLSPARLPLRLSPPKGTLCTAPFTSIASQATGLRLQDLQGERTWGGWWCPPMRVQMLFYLRVWKVTKEEAKMLLEQLSERDRRAETSFSGVSQAKRSQIALGETLGLSDCKCCLSSETPCQGQWSDIMSIFPAQHPHFHSV